MNSHYECEAGLDRKVLVSLLKSVSSYPEEDADTLLDCFPSLQHAVRADHQVLAQIVGDGAANLLRTIPDAVASMTRQTAINAASYILTLEASKTHIGALLNGRRNEAFVVIYLNIKNRLISEDVWEGSIDRTTIYPREIMRRAIMLDASTVIVAHNHPSGDTTPSLSDLKETIRLQDALSVIDIVLLDHLIFGEGEPYSLRENGEI